MDFDFRLYVWTAVIVAMVGVAIVQMWPRRRRREIVVSRRIAAPPERIWQAYHIEPDNPVSAAFHNTVVSHKIVGSDPETIELVSDVSGGHRTHTSVARYEVVALDPPRRAAWRYVQFDNQRMPFGEDNVEEFTLEEDGDASTATLSWRGETSTVGQYSAIKKRLNQFQDSLKSFCESGQGVSVPEAGQSPWKSLGLTALALASFSFLFGWVVAIILSVAIVIHEFGHWLAMRLTGQPKPRIMLVPFFGGVAVPNQPYKTQFDDAFVSLMGAGVSAAPCLALLAAAFFVGDPDLPQLGKLGKSGGSVMVFGPVLYLLAALIGLLNALQLLPVLPLDGGHVVRSLVQSTGARRAKPVLLALTGVGIAGMRPA